MTKIYFTLLILILSCSSIKDVQKTTSVVFVHGAHFTKDSWSLLTKELDRSLDIKAIDLPGRNDSLKHSEITLKSSSKSMCNQLSKKSTVVVHSQAGTVINNALSQCPSKIGRIIYVAAVVPLDGEKAFSKLSKEDEKNYFKGVIFDEKKLSMVVKDSNKFLAEFANKTTAMKKRSLKELVVNEPAPLGDSPVRLPSQLFKRIPKFYIHTLEDRIVSYESQKKIIESIQFNKIYKLNSDHLPMISKAGELAAIISEIIYGKSHL